MAFYESVSQLVDAADLGQAHLISAGSSHIYVQLMDAADLGQAHLMSAGSSHIYVQLVGAASVT